MAARWIRIEPAGRPCLTHAHFAVVRERRIYPLRNGKTQERVRNGSGDFNRRPKVADQARRWTKMADRIRSRTLRSIRRVRELEGKEDRRFLQTGPRSIRGLLLFLFFVKKKPFLFTFVRSDFYLLKRDRIDWKTSKTSAAHLQPDTIWKTVQCCFC